MLDNFGQLALFSLCLISLIFGFISLIKQNVYLDPQNNTITEIEVPLFGRMKTNFPALAFLLFAGLFGYFGYNLSGKISPNLTRINSHTYTIKGKLEDYRIPEKFKVSRKPEKKDEYYLTTGKFQVQFTSSRKSDFNDITLLFTHPEPEIEDFDIDLEEELKLYRNGSKERSRIKDLKEAEYLTSITLKSIINNINEN